MQKARGVGADLDAGPDLANLPRLLIDMRVKSGSQQRQGRRDAADAATNDRNG